VSLLTIVSLLARGYDESVGMRACMETAKEAHTVNQARLRQH
jgi:hypothetical protein